MVKHSKHLQNILIKYIRLFQNTELENWIISEEVY